MSDVEECFFDTQEHRGLSDVQCSGVISVSIAQCQQHGGR